METLLLSYSKYTESDLLNLIQHLISKFSKIRKVKQLSRKISKKLTNSSSLKLFHNISQVGNFSNLSAKRSSVELSFARKTLTRATPKSKSSPYSIDQILTLNNIFNKIVESYDQTTWVRRSSTCYTEIHVVLFKQFLFDCYLTDQTLLTIILEPLNKSLWMGSECFVKCLEEIHSGARWKFFASKRVKKLENNNLHKEKLICKAYLVFAAMIMFEKGDDLDRDSLIRAINLAEKQNFCQLELLADFYVSKATNGKPGFFNIPFQKVFNVIVNLDFSRV